MEAPMWSCHFLLFFLFGCLEAINIPLVNPENQILAAERERVMHFSAHDPCSREGYWLNINNGLRARARNACAQAFDDYDLLTNRERASCPNAQEPDCRPGFGCNQLQYKCTFLCETEVQVWRRQSGEDGRLVRSTITVLKPKPLSAIAATVVEPRIIPEGSAPEVYSRGPSSGPRQRIMAHRPPIED